MKITNRFKVILTGGLIILIQIIIFRDYISPFQWGQIKVKGLACTCPDETVISGVNYLKSITPDSLKKYDLDYSEVYLTERPSSIYDLQGVDTYIIKGHVIGKKRVSEIDPWNPLIKVDYWREVNFLWDIGLKILLFVQLIILGVFVRKK